MRGKVLTVASATAPGIISGEDGIRYQYDLPDLRSAAPYPGQDVDFEAAGASARSVYAIAGSGGAHPPAFTLPERDWVQFYLSPRGRITRRDYWLYGFLVIFAINLVLGFIPLIGQVIAILTLWPSLAVAFKRLHDRSMPGWWIFVPSIPTILGAILVGAGFATSDGADGSMTTLLLGGLLLLVGFVASLWIIFGVLARRGVPGPNEYGPDPLPAQI